MSGWGSFGRGSRYGDVNSRCVHNMNEPLEILRVTYEEDVEDLRVVIKGMVDTGEGSLDLAQLIEMYKGNIESPSTLLMYASNGQGPIGYIYTVLREGPEGLIGVVEQIYSEEPYIGKGLYLLAEMWARDEGATSMRGITSPAKAEGMARLFGVSIQGVVIGKEL